MDDAALGIAVDKLCPPPPMNRAATRARLDSSLKSHTERSGTPESQQEVAACLAFFQIHDQSDFVAFDLQARLRSIGNSSQKSLSRQVNDYVQKVEDDIMNEQVSQPSWPT